ncbi:MAG TPA: phage tail tape measure protein [Methylotenera sp.]
MADKFQLKAILTAVDKITPTTTQIGKSIKIMHKSLRDIGNAGGELMRKIGVPAFLSFSAVTFGAIRATQAAMDYAGSIQDAADRTGASVEGYQAMANMLGLVGGTAEDAEMAFTKFNKGVAEGSSGADKNFAGLMKKLGIPLKNAKGELVGLTDVLPELAAGFAKNKNPAIQTRMAMELWGKSGTKMIPLLNGLADGSISLEQAMKDIVNKQAITDLDNMGDSITALGTKTKNTLTNALAKMVPVIQPIIDSMSRWISENQEFLQSQIAGAITEVANAIKQVNWVETFKGIQATVADIRDFINAIGGVKTLIYGLGLAWAAGPIAAIMSIVGAIWRMRLAFKGLKVDANNAGTAVSDAFTKKSAAGLTGTLNMMKNNAGLMAAAFGVGYAIGGWINDSLLSEKFKNQIGETIAQTLAFFGNDTAAAALAANGKGPDKNVDRKSTYQNPTGLFTSSKQYADAARNKSNLVGNNQTKLNGEMTVKFENAPPGTRVDVGKTNQSGVFMNADVGYRRMVAGF